MKYLKTDKIDSRAFYEEIYLKYFDVLYLFSQRIVSSSDAAKDIVQDVFLDFWQRWDEIDFSYSVKPYLYRLTYNKSLDYLKLSDNKNESLTHNPLLVDQLFYTTFTHDDDLYAEEIGLEIQSCIKTLPSRCKEVFILSRKNNLKNREIADKLNISIKAVEKHISKALTTIRERLIYLDYLALLVSVLINIFN